MVMNNRLISQIEYLSPGKVDWTLLVEWIARRKWGKLMHRYPGTREINRPGNEISHLDSCSLIMMWYNGRKNIRGSVYFFIPWISLMWKIEIEGKCYHGHSNHELKVNTVILIQIIKQIHALFSEKYTQYEWINGSSTCFSCQCSCYNRLNVQTHIWAGFYLGCNDHRTHQKVIETIWV
jgi:hypothetical protein